MCWLNNISPSKIQIAMKDDMLMLTTEEEEINQSIAINANVLVFRGRGVCQFSF